MKKFKIKPPRDDMEYTFVFPGRKTATFIFYGENAKGRYILLNKQTNTFTTMSPGWFSKLKKNQLLCEKPIEVGAVEMPVKKVVEEPKKKRPEDEILNELRSLCPSNALKVRATIGRSAEELADDLESMWLAPEGMYTQEHVNRLGREMMTALTCF